MSTVVCPGSFDPLTYGHVDIVRRAAQLFDNVIVCVAHNPNKQGLFTVAERLEILQEEFSDIPNVTSCLLYTSPSPRDVEESRMPSSA